MTDPIDAQRDGFERDRLPPAGDSSERDRLAPAGADIEPGTRGAQADEPAPGAPADMPDAAADVPDASAEMPDASAEMPEASTDTPDASADIAVSGEASVDAGAVADDPEQANGQVAAALAELDAAAGWPPADQVAAFTAAHETLQATLARIDDH